MKRRLDTIGLQWATFQVLRRIHASLGHDAGIDPKVAADQRGHGIGVAIDVYTKAALSKRVEAAERLETPCLPLLPAFGPIQWSASSWHQANAEITSNTWSEKPPMFKIATISACPQRSGPSISWATLPAWPLCVCSASSAAAISRCGWLGWARCDSEGVGNLCVAGNRP
jgi:hypothetical protein